MLYLRMCFDDESATHVRGDILKRHREYIASFIPGRDGVKVVQGGPMCSDDSCKKNIGSFLVVEGSSHADVVRFHDNDPFTRAKLFSRFELIRWDRHIGNEGQGEYVP